MNPSSLPTLFIGHGSPLNAIQQNPFTRTLRDLMPRISKTPPKAVLVISAHWETEGIFIQNSDHPRTIHDFGGFPDELHQVTYPAPGSKNLARRVQTLLASDGAQLTEEWGFDHGTWSVLKHLMPEANVPIVQLSLDRQRSPRQHFEMAKKLEPLREEGILILGTGNLIHNLRRLDWNPSAAPADWAKRFDVRLQNLILKKSWSEILQLTENQNEDFRLSVPSLDHFLPFLYVAAISRPEDVVDFPYEGIEMSSISMRSVLFHQP